MNTLNALLHLNLFTLLGASFGEFTQAATDTVVNNPLKSMAGVLAAIVGILKMIGIGPLQYKDYITKFIAWASGKIPGDTTIEKIGLASLEQILIALMDKLLSEGVDPEDAEKIVNGIAPQVQSARLERFQQAMAAKAAEAEHEPPTPKSAKAGQHPPAAPAEAAAAPVAETPAL